MNQQWGADALPTPSWAGYGSGSLGGPYYIPVPSSPGVGYLNYTGSSTQWVAVECVTSAPHNLKTGQQIQLDVYTSGTFAFSNGATATVTGAVFNEGLLTVYVTGPTTFAFAWYPYPATPPTGGSGASLPAP